MMTPMRYVVLVLGLIVSLCHFFMIINWVHNFEIDLNPLYSELCA